MISDRERERLKERQFKKRTVSRRSVWRVGKRVTITGYLGKSKK